MKIRNKLFISLILISVSANAATEEELCNIPQQNSFRTVIGGLNQFLMSANPMRRHSEVSDDSIIKRVYNLPPLETNVSKPVVERQVIFTQPEMPVIPRPSFLSKEEGQQIEANTVSAEPVFEKQIAKLSPNTKNVFNSIPNGLGEKYAPAQQITISRESFKAPEIADGAENSEFEEILTQDTQEEGTSPQFEISVSNQAPKQDITDRYNDALKALSVGQYESAVALYKNILKDNPNNREALFGLATSYHSAGERKKARDAYSNLLKAYPKFEDGISNFISLASQEAPEHALQELILLQKNNPEFPAIFAQKGLIYSKLGDKKQAIKNLAYALKLDPKDNNYKYNLAVLLDEADQYEYALQLYQELVKDSYAGQDIPVGRAVLKERADLIAGLIRR